MWFVEAAGRIEKLRNGVSGVTGVSEAKVADEGF